MLDISVNHNCSSASNCDWISLGPCVNVDFVPGLEVHGTAKIIRDLFVKEITGKCN
jgi:hypothetical protein